MIFVIMVIGDSLWKVVKPLVVAQMYLKWYDVLEILRTITMTYSQV